MTRKKIAAHTPYANMLGYSRVVVDGREAWVAGCAPLDDAGELIGAGCAYRQSRQCLDIIVAALGKAGFSPSDIVRTRIYIRSFDDIEAITRAHREVFEQIRPASTVIAVADLVLPEMRVYMDADARRA